MSCLNCGEEARIAEVMAHCSDRCSYMMGESCRIDYVPENVGIGGGDDVTFRYCLECGQIQSEFPIQDEAIADAFDGEFDEQDGEVEEESFDE